MSSVLQMLTDHQQTNHRPFMEVASKNTPPARNVREAAVDARAREISNRKLAASAKPRGSTSGAPTKAAPSPKRSPRGDVMGLVKNTILVCICVFLRARAVLFSAHEINTSKMYVRSEHTMDGVNAHYDIVADGSIIRTGRGTFVLGLP